MKNEQNKRKFRGIWIPADIWENNKLNIIQKTMLAEIDSLSGTGKCFASNQYFADFFGISKRRISSIISELNEMGLIKVDLIYKGKTKQVEKRLISLVQNISLVNVATKNDVAKHISKTDKSKEMEIDNIVQMWNKATGQQLRTDTPNTRKLISGLLKRGFTGGQLIGVARVKHNEWGGNIKTKKWVRPSTVFGGKFDEYFQQYEQQKQNVGSTSIIVSTSYFGDKA